MAMLFSGCSSLGISGQHVSTDDQAIAGNQANVIVVKQANGRDPVATTIPYNPSMVVDEALAKSGGKSWFGRSKIQVVRGSENGETLKMDVEYDNSEDRVEPLYNYALHAGDRVIVEEDKSNALTDMLDQLNPL
jgi:hypothetical protein